jgi:hypothetical protein
MITTIGAPKQRPMSQDNGLAIRVMAAARGMNIRYRKTFVLIDQDPSMTSPVAPCTSNQVCVSVMHERAINIFLKKLTPTNPADIINPAK